MTSILYIWDPIVGSDGSDVLNTIATYKSDENEWEVYYRIEGRGGDDTLTALIDFQSALYGGDGNDSLFGGWEDDYLYGNNDADYLVGSNGDDYLAGGTGDDHLLGGNGNDQLFGEEGNDILDGGSGDDYFWEGYNWPYSGDDIMYGREGEDSLEAGSGDDQLFGGDDDDHLDGMEGDDVIHGDGGDDLINASFGGVDRLYGDEGDDTFSISGNQTEGTADGGSGVDTVGSYNLGNFAFANMEVLDGGDTGFINGSIAQFSSFSTITFSLLAPGEAAVLALQGIGGTLDLSTRMEDFAAFVQAAGVTGAVTITGTINDDGLSGSSENDFLRGMRWPGLSVQESALDKWSLRRL